MVKITIYRIIQKSLCAMIFVIIFQTNAQSFFEVFDQYKRDGVNDFETKGDSLISRCIGQDHYIDASKIAHSLSLFYYNNDDIIKSIYYGKKQIEFLGLLDSVEYEYENALNNMGYFYYKNHEYLKAIDFWEKVIELKIDKVKYRDAHNLIGRSYAEVGDYQKSISYFKKDISFYQDSLVSQLIFNKYVNLANTYMFVGTERSISKSIKVFNYLDSVAKYSAAINIDRRSMDNNYGLLLTNSFIHDYEKAIKIYKRIIREEKSSQDELILSNAYNNLAYIYNLQKRDSSFYFIHQGLTHSQSFDEVSARLYDNLCDYQILKGNLFGALESIQTSINLTNKEKVIDVPTPHQIRQSILLDYTLYCLKKKTEILIKLFNKNNEPRFLNQSIKNIEASEQVIEILLNNTDEYLTKIIWRREASQAYLYGAYASHLLGDYDQVFEFMEKNKALLLSASVLKNTEFANLPKNISDEEIRRQKLIYKLEDELSQDSANSLIQDSLFVAKRSHEKYVDSLKTIFPKYYSRKIDLEQVSLKDVKDELNNNQVLISFIWNEFDRDNELVVGLVASNEFNRSFTIHKTDNLKSLIKDYQKLISRPFETKDDEKEFQHIAFKLYEMLFPDKEIRDLIMKKELMIIGDGLLQNIPFESLIRTADVNDYLVLNNNIHYLYSYSFLEQNKKVNRKSTNSFIGYSPNRFTDSLLINLSHTREEVTDINSEFGGVIKLNDSATKKDFLQNSSSAKIIHLATHADGGENPWVAFADDKLQLHELYTFKNNADLVTLSACNTSLGDMAKGEGVISLARGFFHSGSKSVVSSLWKVNDKSTSGIMRSFYKGLKGGETKSEALNNAKRAYLNTHSLSAQSPYYWSSFVLLGDSSEVDVQSNNYLYYGLVLLFIPLGVLVRRKFRKAG